MHGLIRSRPDECDESYENQWGSAKRARYAGQAHLQETMINFSAGSQIPTYAMSMDVDNNKQFNAYGALNQACTTSSNNRLSNNGAVPHAGGMDVEESNKTEIPPAWRNSFRTQRAYYYAGQDHY